MSQQPFQAAAPENEPVTSQSRNLVASRKQDFNIYTVMLLLSFAFLLVGTLLMVNELRSYPGGFSGSWKTSAATPAAAP